MSVLDFQPANTVALSTQEVERMARRRYQDGCVYRRGDVWVGRWREDEVDAEGKIRRRLKSETWKVAEYPTKRLVQRELKRKLAEVNARSYRAKPQTNFEVFAKKWETTVLPNFKSSNQPPMRGQLRKHLVPALGSFALANLTGEPLQVFVSNCKLSPKTIKNLVATLSIMWNTAKAWRLVEHDPSQGLKLPEQNPEEARCFAADEIRRIIEEANEPYRTLYWIAGETGIRMGELCGLKWDNINLDRGIVQIKQSSWRGELGTPKSKKGIRAFAISPGLWAALAEKRSTDPVTDSGLVFHTSNDTPWDGDTTRKRKLHPLCDRLGIARGGFNAFRHGNATIMDQVSVPTKVRQDRLGHADIETTNRYTHLVSEDDKRAAAELERVIVGPKQVQVPTHAWQIRAGNA